MTKMPYRHQYDWNFRFESFQVMTDMNERKKKIKRKMKNKNYII